MSAVLERAVRRFEGVSNLVCCVIIVAGGILVELIEYSKPGSLGGLWELRNQPPEIGTPIIIGIIMSLAAFVWLSRIMQLAEPETSRTQEG